MPLGMGKTPNETAGGFTAGERDYIRRELDMFFSTLPRVADGFQLKTWRGGPLAKQPKVPPVARGLIDRGLMRLDADGTLRIETLPETAGLRAGRVSTEKVGAGTESVLKRANGEVVCSGNKGNSFGFTLSTDAGELLGVQYVGERHVFVADGKEIALEAGDVPRLHAFVDGSVIELIVSERIGYTKRFYYAGAIAPDVTASGEPGATLEAWTVAPISANRLTTPAVGV